MYICLSYVSLIGYWTVFLSYICAQFDMCAVSQLK